MGAFFVVSHGHDVGHDKHGQQGAGGRARGKELGHQGHGQGSYAGDAGFAHAGKDGGEHGQDPLAEA
jgi:hypothetical protein